MSLNRRDLRRLALLARGAHLEHKGAEWVLVKGRHRRGIQDTAALLLLVVVLGAEVEHA